MVFYNNLARLYCEGANVLCVSVLCYFVKFDFRVWSVIFSYFLVLFFFCLIVLVFRRFLIILCLDLTMKPNVLF